MVVCQPDNNDGTFSLDLSTRIDQESYKNTDRVLYYQFGENLDENSIHNHAVLLIDGAWRKCDGKGVAALYVKIFPINWGTRDECYPTWEVYKVVAPSAKFTEVKSCLNALL